jgi:ParB family chromosome partitioning protein
MKSAGYRSLQSELLGLGLLEKAYFQIPLEMADHCPLVAAGQIDPSALREIVNTLKAGDINFEPVIVRPGKGAGRFEVIAGHDILAAARECELSKVMCCSGSFSDTQASVVNALYRLYQGQLTPVVEARLYAQLEGCGLTHQHIAQSVSKSRTHITNHLRLLSLPRAVQALLDAGDLSFSQARVICSVRGAAIQTRLARKAVKDGWSARDIQRELKDKQEGMPDLSSRTWKPTPEILQGLIHQHTGHPCVVRRTDRGGWQLGISAGCTDDFVRILQGLGLELGRVDLES